MKLMNYFNNNNMVVHYVYVLSVPRVTFRMNERVGGMI